MSAYYGGPACWFLSENYKAAHNHVILGPTIKLLTPLLVAQANARARIALEDSGLGTEPTPEVLNCFLAAAFAEMEVCPRIPRANGKLFVGYWYREKNIPEACAKMTHDDVAKAIDWLTHMCDGRQ